jgi:hypothetical protein
MVSWMDYMKKEPAIKAKFKKNDKVFKPNGYPFPGVILAAFTTNAGEWRYVVENECGGLLHIFNTSQLRKTGCSARTKLRN